MEVKTVETIFLVKISKNLLNFISNFEDDKYSELSKEAPLYENGSPIADIMGIAEE